ncbi:MAG: holo-ACP synthase [Congregibacter sp.]
MLGIGTDIIEIDRVEAIWHRQGARFARRILCEQELRACEEKREPWRYLAKRFAAKEAIAKCLGTGIGVSLSWQDLMISNVASGAPAVSLNARAQALAEDLGGTRVLLSISDEKHYAVAFAALVP